MKPNLNPYFTFENFVVGESNEEAYKTALKVSENPAESKYNLVIIKANTGLGKSHLIEAIGNNSLKNNYKVRCISAKILSDEIRWFALKNNNNKKFFYNNYCSLDVLIVDNIELFKTQENDVQNLFIDLCNSLINGKRLIVLAGSTYWENDEKFIGRILKLTDKKIIKTIEKPDYDLRFRILKKRVIENAIFINDDTLFLIALKVNSNIRLLLVALYRISRHLIFNSHKITNICVNKIISKINCEFKV